MSTKSDAGVLDRFEAHAGVIVSDDGRLFLVNRRNLPADARPGSVLSFTVDVAGRVIENTLRLDEEETARREREAKELLDELQERDPGGDIVL